METRYLTGSYFSKRSFENESKCNCRPLFYLIWYRVLCKPIFLKYKLMFLYSILWVVQWCSGYHCHQIARVRNYQPTGAFLCSVCMFSPCLYGFPPGILVSAQMQIKSTCYSKMCNGVKVNCCLSFCVSSAIDWQLAWFVHLLSVSLAAAFLRLLMDKHYR